MNWFTRIVCAIVIVLVFLVYCWMLKNNPVKTESLLFREVHNIPKMSFSKLADIDSRLAAELDVIPIDEYEKIRNEELEQFMINFKQEEPVVRKANGLLRVVFLICLSVAGILILLCLGRIIIPKCRHHSVWTESDRDPIVSPQSKEETKKNYQTEKY